jgi:hypothetical protein
MVCDIKKVCISLENLPSRQVLYHGTWNAARDDTGRGASVHFLPAH